jgi:hypothetical protein
MRELSKLRPDSEEEMVPTDIRYDGAMSELVESRIHSRISYRFDSFHIRFLVYHKLLRSR